MTESARNISDKVGLPPGSLIHIGDVLTTMTRMSVIDYTKENVEERQIQSIAELLPYKESETVTWVVIEGLANVEIVEQIGAMFGIHQLVLEDILNTHQRPKFEEYDEYLYIVLKSLIPEEEDDFSVSYEQVSLLVLKNIVITFKEKADQLFQPIIQRIQTSKGRFRSQGSDYLTYAILDTIVDQCFILIDTLDDATTSLELSLLNSESTKSTLNSIQRLKRELITIRRYVSPIRELMAAMLRSESELIHEKTFVYLRDVSDHAIRIIESIESYRDILSGLLEIYISYPARRRGATAQGGAP